MTHPFGRSGTGCAAVGRLGLSHGRNAWALRHDGTSSGLLRRRRDRAFCRRWLQARLRGDAQP